MSNQRSRSLAGLGELQLRTLEALSKIGEGTVYDVLDQFPEEQRPKYTTVLTVLRRMEDKGVVSHRTVDRAYVFRTAVEPRRVRGQVIRDLLDRVFVGSPKELFSCLLEYGSVTPEELQELKALIAEKEAEGDDG